MTSESTLRPTVTHPFLQAFSPAKKERDVTDLKFVEKTFWVVELEQDGSVLYSRPHIVEFGDKAITVSEGLNFFEEITGLADVARCRQKLSIIRTRS